MYSVSNIFEVRADFGIAHLCSDCTDCFPLDEGCYWCWYPEVLLVLLLAISIQDLQWVLDRVSSLICDYHSPVRGRVCSSDSFLSCHVR